MSKRPQGRFIEVYLQMIILIVIQAFSLVLTVS